MSTAASHAGRAGRPAGLPTVRGRRTQAAIDMAARLPSRARASLPPPSPTSRRKPDVRRFRDEANERALAVTEHRLSDRERAHAATAAHWHTYRHRLAEVISVSQVAMINDDFAQHWAEICDIPISFIAESVGRAQAEGHCRGDDPRLIAEAIVAMFNQFCYIQLGGPRAAEPDDQACIQTLANIYYRTIYT